MRETLRGKRLGVGIVDVCVRVGGDSGELGVQENKGERKKRLMEDSISCLDWLALRLFCFCSLFLFLRFPFSSVVLPAPTIVVFFSPFSYDFPFLRFPLRPKHNSVFLDVSMTPCQFDNLFIDFLAFLPFFFLLPSLLFFLVLVLPRSVFLCSLSGFVLGLYGGRWITLGIE
jgi:hypothetical protein